MVVRDVSPQPYTGDLPHPFDSVSGRVVITLFHSIAILSTLYRLIHRVRIHRFSWDDWLACLALLLIVLYLITDWLRVKLIQTRSSTEPMEYLAYLIDIYWVSLSFSLAILWCSRASLSLSLARILPPGRHRTFSIIYAVLSLPIGCAFIIAHNTACTWKRTTNVLSPGLLRCLGGGTLFIITTASGLTSTLILVVLPLHCLWRITTDLPKSERRLILTLFTSSFLTFIVCLVHAVYIIKGNSLAITFSSKLQASISLIVCNSVVVVPNLYTLFFRRHAHAEEGDQSGSSYVRTGPTTPVHDTTSQTAKPDHSDTYNFELTRISDVNLSFSSDPDFVQHTSTRVDDVEVRTMPQG